MDDLPNQKLQLIVNGKVALREAQREQTWVQRVEAMARMNAAGRVAKAAMQASKAKNSPAKPS